jgi:hypothetical protein
MLNRELIGRRVICPRCKVESRAEEEIVAIIDEPTFLERNQKFRLPALIVGMMILANVVYYLVEFIAVSVFWS